MVLTIRIYLLADDLSSFDGQNSMQLFTRERIKNRNLSLNV